ncbi:MAG: hypothetical protein LBR23_02540 [Spirochaetaceae bacterium]|nr:hypothetical protein [Spirochaetaceae bacterium]
MTVNSEPRRGLRTNIIVLTKNERASVARILRRLKAESPVIHGTIKGRFRVLTRLADVIAHFPSLLDRKAVADSSGRSSTLIDALLVPRQGDTMLHLPAKATLGKGFLVAKFQLFRLLSGLAQQHNMKEGDIRDIRAKTGALMFTLMAEDVYLNLLDDRTLPLEMRRQAAMWLILLWDHRTDFIAKDTAPVLQALWDCRADLAPAFGTMKGKFEFLLVSSDLDEKWQDFAASITEGSAAGAALQEFLFGLSYEQIDRVNRKMKEQGVTAVDRDEISAFLGEDIKFDLSADQRDFYMFYTYRRDNARARRRLGLAGPHFTLEDYYIRFMLKRYKETLFNDLFL